MASERLQLNPAGSLATSSERSIRAPETISYLYIIAVKAVTRFLARIANFCWIWLVFHDNDSDGCARLAKKMTKGNKHRGFGRTRSEDARRRALPLDEMPVAMAMYTTNDSVGGCLSRLHAVHAWEHYHGIRSRQNCKLPASNYGLRTTNLTTQFSRSSQSTSTLQVGRLSDLGPRSASSV